MGLRISEAKALMEQIVAFNIQQATSKKGHSTFIVPFFRSPPGLGKTSMIRQTASGLSVSYRQCILAQYDAGELAGLVMFNEDKSRAIRLRPDYLPDEKRDGPCGIFNLDELPQAFLANLNIAAQLTNEWCIGEHKVPLGWTICCTGNRAEDKAGTVSLPAHLKDRLMFIDLDVNNDDWLEYSAQNGIDARVRAYIRQNPGKLMEFKPGTDANPTPRSWEKVSAILTMDLTKVTRSNAVMGQIGEGHAQNFLAWLAVEDKLPNVLEVIENPETAPIFGDGKEMSITYLLLCSLADHANKSNIKKILTYLGRLKHQELSIFCMHDAIKRDPSLAETEAVRNWKMTVVSGLLF